MKAFVISIVTLLLVFGVIIWNFLYINNIYAYMSETVTELSQDEASMVKVDELWKSWKRKSVLIALSVPHRISDEVERNLTILRSRVHEGSRADFLEAKELLLNSIEEMRIHAGASLDSIF